MCWMHLIFCFAILIFFCSYFHQTWKYLTYFLANDLISRNSNISFFEQKKMDSQFSVAKLCSNPSCTLSASIGFIIFKYKRRIRTNKTSSFYPEVLQVGPAAVTCKCCFQMHLTLNLMQENMWKKDCINYCRKKVNWFR